MPAESVVAPPRAHHPVVYGLLRGALCLVAGVALAWLCYATFAQSTDGHAFIEWVFLAAIVVAAGDAIIQVVIQAHRATRSATPMTRPRSYLLLDLVITAAALFLLGAAALSARLTPTTYHTPHSRALHATQCVTCIAHHSGSPAAIWAVAILLGAGVVCTVTWGVLRIAIPAYHADLVHPVATPEPAPAVVEPAPA